MTPDARKHYEEMAKNKRRIYPVKNISDQHPRKGVVVCSIPPGQTGLASAVEILQHRYHLKEITVDGWSNEGFEPDDPIKQRKANNKGGEAQGDEE